MPRIKDVSVFEDVGIQVVIESMCFHDRLDFKNIITEGMEEWPRIRAAGEQLKQDVPELKELKLVRVDQKLSLGGLFLEQQFSFV